MLIDFFSLQIRSFQLTVLKSTIFKARKRKFPRVIILWQLSEHKTSLYLIIVTCFVTVTSLNMNEHERNLTGTKFPKFPKGIYSIPVIIEVFFQSTLRHPTATTAFLKQSKLFHSSSSSIFRTYLLIMFRHNIPLPQEASSLTIALQFKLLKILFQNSVGTLH